eukprot:CAMPEP_0201687518 /NCGR_PEP_ID=MMETSP0578-20130828/1543_1 /ASSEMBLY_ACC=CAM_ASM_000663 /TAXON_ID=267565 /ORGANISM="Skeletonema grethea, Strain CCMP 1804" /LENGTH=527 /DNA_ID=CAMNT_0048171679 /DNA_START=295 /DNA_END=1878 /DNA_ORIENTATION=+
MSSKKKNGGSAPEVPIFLQKTYHMIDTCPATIATWSSDGLTFIVKNTHLFETTIIPQFFKHSKFSSFVRQLNFYGFRKIRFENSLKIDLEKEREQRNFWRFKHENFRRGRKDLLRDIKRSASSSSSSSSSAAAAGNGSAAANTAAVSPNATTSNAQAASPSPNNTSTTTAAITTPAPQEVTRLNTEVNTLKEQMQSMATKMDDLTCLVKGMNVSPPPEVGGGEGEVSVGNKRKKVDTDSMNVMMPPEHVPSSSMMTANNETKMQEVDVDIILPFSDDNIIHNMSLEDAATTLLPDLTLSNPSSAGPSSLLPTPLLSRCSSLNMDMDVAPSAAAAAMGGEEEDFVDELFHAFATDDTTTATTAAPPLLVEENPNKPDPQLMKRIEDSLSTIPKTMHEMVANRLIDAIAEGSSATAACSSSSSSEGATIVRSPSCESSVAASPNNNKSVDKENTLNRSSSSSSIIPEGATTTAAAEAEQTSIPLPLAIATLKTILADYGLKVECGSSSEDANLHRRLSNKSLPLVPIHA